MKTYQLKSLMLALGTSMLLASPVIAGTQSRIQINLGPAWRFHAGEIPGNPFTVKHDDSKWDIVSLPHSLQLFPANLDGFSERGRGTGWYRREVVVQKGWAGKRLYLEFRGAMQTTTLWVNGQTVGEYAVSGYDSFSFDITRYLKPGANVLAVRVDNRFNPDIPPDGQTMDYVLFGGLYRDVFLHVIDSLHLTFPWEARHAGVRITLPEVSDGMAVVQSEATVRNDSAHTRACVVATEIQDGEGQVVKVMTEEREVPAGGETTFTQRSDPISNPHLWSPEDPYLYKATTVVRDGAKELDRWETPVGIRWVKFDQQRGFFLNGKQVKLIGANCHQSWPFIGYAVPAGLHRRDAEQLKAMGVNWVRLSHYPQDPAFLDALDELGLMALEEPPTWNQPGPAKWKENLVASYRSMIRRDRNHPSIIVWNACLNHGPGDPDLIRAAVEEDPSRDRGNDTVRVTMDFRPQRVSGGGALAIEHTGHTYPAARGSRAVPFHLRTYGLEKAYEPANREYEQARRHWEQLNAAYLKPDNAGLAVWCMYDYNTFYNVNEPGMVWHGVCDLFRLPKFSYWWHVSELTAPPMAYLVRVDPTNAVVFSNCEQVRLWQEEAGDYRELAVHKPDTSFATLDAPLSLTGLPQRAIPPGVASTTPSWVSYALRHPPFHFTVSSDAKRLKAEGIIGSAVAATNEWKQPGKPAALVLEADRRVIAADGADLSRIIVTAVDADGTSVDTSDARVSFSIKGLGQLIGENPVKLRAGKMIILAQSAFVPGEMTIIAEAEGLRPATVAVKTRPVGGDVDMPKHLPARQPTCRVLISGSTALPGK